MAERRVLCSSVAGILQFVFVAARICGQSMDRCRDKRAKTGQNHNVGKDNSIIVAGRSSEQTVVKKQVRTNGKMAAQPCRDGARIACKAGA